MANAHSALNKEMMAATPATDPDGDSCEIDELRSELSQQERGHHDHGDRDAEQQPNARFQVEASRPRVSDHLQAEGSPDDQSPEHSRVPAPARD